MPKALKARLEATGMPVAYRQFTRKVTPPYLVHLEEGSHNFAADGTVYQPICRRRVELYTAKKDPIAEARVESALASFVWEKNEAWIESEQLLQVTYDFEE